MPGDLKSIVANIAARKKKTSTNKVPTTGLVAVLNSREGTKTKAGSVGRDEAPVAMTEQKIPKDMNTRKGMMIAVLRKKRRRI